MPRAPASSELALQSKHPRMRLARPIPLFVCCFGAQFLIFPIYIYRLGLEEQMLSSQMGDAYRAYQKRTWRLIPLVY